MVRSSLPTRMPVTQKDIAQHLGISRQIVGQALTGHPRVAKETRRRVEDTARELGYNAQSNREARALIARRYGKRVKNQLIAMFLPAVDKDSSVRQHPFFMSILDGVEIEATERDYDLTLCRMRMGRQPRMLVEGYVDGVISMFVTPELVSLCESMSLPLVALVARGDGAYSILPDDRQGMRVVTEHLLDLGHTRIAYLGLALQSQNAADRYRGFKEALKSRRLAGHKELIENTLPGIHPGVGTEATERLLQRGEFTALVCYNDQTARDAIAVLQKRGLRVPQDISVVGFDGVSTPYNLEPALTTVYFNRQLMGRRAVELIDMWTSESQETGQSSFKPGLETAPVELIIGSSTMPR